MFERKGLSIGLFSVLLISYYLLLMEKTRVK